MFLNKFPSIAITLPSIGACFLALMSLSGNVYSETKEEKVPLADLQRFTKVIEYIKEYYVKPINDDALFENAMRGMLSGLDPHSSYFDTEEFADLKANTSGKFGGLGVEILPEDGYIRVISPIDGTPAQRAGIQAGDLIVRLNDTPIKGLSPREAIELMRGEKGSKISLTIVRQGENKPLIIDLIRDTINVQSVRGKLLDENLAYVRISQFQNNSGDELIRTIQTLKKNNKNKLNGIILDLRNNPGGIFDTSVQIADAFLDRDKLTQYDGVIVYAKGRLPNAQIKEKAHGGDLLNGAPIVILINGGTASSSEIVAGALQDYGRALVVGETSFGKGSIQTVFPLKDNRGLKLTTGLYYTPAGRSIQATGIKPDIFIQNLKIPAPKEKENPNLFMIREQDLLGHLENGSAVKKEDKKDPKDTSKGVKKDLSNQDNPIDLTNLLYTDYQLYEALNILRGLTFSPAKKAA
jgi:carboxyl-terminal processing protease